MELHHSKHHQTYVTNLNTALKSQAEAFHALDITSQIALQQAIKFSAGGHINHSLFWRNLAPAGSAEAKPSAAPQLLEQIQALWGDEEKFRDEFNAALLGIQGSGWGWLIKVQIGKQQRLAIVTTKDQDPIVGKEVPLLGIDMWEHGYYLQVSQFGGFCCSTVLSLTILVSKQQSCLCQEYMECHQLEDCGGTLPWISRGYIRDPHDKHLGVYLVV